MAYATASTVQAEFADIAFSTTSKVTTADVTLFLAQADALIDSYVGARYTTPVTADASALALLQLFASTIVADKIKGILKVKNVQNPNPNIEVRNGMTTAQVLKQLEAIRDGVTNLSGANELAAGNGFYSSQAAAGLTTRFKKDEVAW
jgi:hypothetical protein